MEAEQNGATSFDTAVKRKASYHYEVNEESTGFGCCGWFLTVISWFLVGVTFPFSLCVCLRVVQEYERAVIFRLGRLLSGGTKGPGTSPCHHHHHHQTFIVRLLQNYKLLIRT